VRLRVESRFDLMVSQPTGVCELDLTPSPRGLPRVLVAAQGEAVSVRSQSGMTFENGQRASTVQMSVCAGQTAIARAVNAATYAGEFELYYDI